MNNKLIIMCVFFLAIISCKNLPLSKTMHFEYVGGPFDKKMSIDREFLNDSVFVDYIYLLNSCDSILFTSTETYKVVRGNWFLFVDNEYQEFLPIQDFKDNKPSYIYDESFGCSWKYQPITKINKCNKTIYVYSQITVPNEDSEILELNKKIILFDREIGVIRIHYKQYPEGEQDRILVEKKEYSKRRKK